VLVAITIMIVAIQMKKFLLAQMLMKVSKVYMNSVFCLLGFCAASGVVRFTLISPELLRLFVFTAFP